MIFAEMDAIMNSRPNCPSLKGCTLYSLVFPYYLEAKMMVELDLKKVVYYSDNYKGKPFREKSHAILQQAGIEMEEYRTTNVDLKKKFESLAKAFKIVK